MQKCDKCNVMLAAEKNRCPLCQRKVSGEYNEDAEIFPIVPQGKKRFFLLIRIMAFFSSVTVFTCALINYLLTPDIYWSVIVLISIIFMWLIMINSVRRMHNIPKNIIWQVVIFSIGMVAIDIAVGWRGWSINYAIPAICTLSLCATFAFAIFMKMHIEQYLVYAMLNALAGILPLIFLLLGWATVPWPSLTCVTLSLVSFSALFSFAGKPIMDEIKKRLHI